MTAVAECLWSEVRDGMRIDWDVPIVMDDGLVLRADVYRPTAPGRYPVILAPQAVAAQPQVSVADAGNETKVVKASVTIDAPAGTVWQTITDYNSLSAYMPGYKKSQVVTSSGASKTVDMSVKVASLLPAFNYRIQVKENRGAQRVDIKRISGDFDSFQASYRLVPQGNKTLLVYELSIDPGSKVPPIGVNGTLKSNAADSLSALGRKCADNYKKSMVAAAKRP